MHKKFQPPSGSTELLLISGSSYFPFVHVYCGKLSSLHITNISPCKQLAVTQVLLLSDDKDKV